MDTIEQKYYVTAYIKTNRTCVAGIHTFVGNISKIEKWIKENMNPSKNWNILQEIENNERFNQYDQDGNHIVVKKYVRG